MQASLSTAHQNRNPTRRTLRSGTHRGELKSLFNTLKYNLLNLIKHRQHLEGLSPPPFICFDDLLIISISAIITIAVGREQRLFAAHEDVLSHSPFFAHACTGQFFQTANKRIDLPDEEPEVFSSILEYLYKGDYFPRMEYDKKRNSWNLEDGLNGNGANEAVVQSAAGPILKDTIIYCQAEKYGLQELKKLALRKQGLQSGIQCSTILTSARYAYANTPDSDSKLRAHYLALIIRARHTFKRSGTMQNEMEHGGKLFFDLFVAMVNHMDDLKSPH